MLSCAPPPFLCIPVIRLHGSGGYQPVMGTFHKKILTQLNKNFNIIPFFVLKIYDSNFQHHINITNKKENSKSLSLLLLKLNVRYSNLTFLNFFFILNGLFSSFYSYYLTKYLLILFYATAFAFISSITFRIPIHTFISVKIS